MRFYISIIATILSIMSTYAIGSFCRVYRVEDGLSQNTIWCAHQDKYGFIWLGTKDGLNRFDGNTFTVFRNDPDNSMSIGNNFIRAICEDEGYLYIGTDNGLFLYNMESETFTPIDFPDTDTDKQLAINSIISDNDGNLWIGTFGQGIFLYDKTNHVWKRYKAESRNDTLKSDLIWKLFIDSKGVVWIGTIGGGLSKYDATKKVFTSYGREQNIDSDIYDIYEDNQHRLWIGTWSRGLISMNPTDETFKEHVSPEVCEAIRCIHQTDTGTLLFGGNTGLFEYNINTNHCESIPIYSSTSRASIKDGIYSILEDHEGGLWVGGYFAGVNYTHPNINSISHYRLAVDNKYLTESVVSQMIEDDRHNIWAATEDQGLACFNRETDMVSFIRPPVISHTNLHALMRDGNHLWVGNIQGTIDVIDITKNSRVRRMTVDDGLDVGSIYSIYKTAEGEIYVGGLFGLLKYNSQKMRFYHIEQVPWYAYIYDITQDHSGNIWVATYGEGIFVYDSTKKSWHKHINVPGNPKSLPNNKIISLHVDDNNSVWIGSEGGGISSYNPMNDNFRTITEKNGLPNNVIYGILSDKLGGMWVSSNRGVSCIHINGDSIVKISYTDGLQRSQFNYKSYLRLSDGSMCFGGIGGINIFNPNTLTSNNIIPPVVISGCVVRHKDGTDEHIPLMAKADGKNVPSIDLYDINFISFDFAALSYIEPGKNLYAFRLKGVDSDWVYSGSANDSHNPIYRNLSPGSYVFEVKGANGDGVWNPEIASIKFDIHPPIYKSTTAYIIYVMALLSMIAFFIYLFKTKSEHKRNLAHLRYEQEKQQEYYETQLSFFTNMAHEIRTPLSLISAPLEDIDDMCHDNEECKEALTVMKDNTNRLMQLVNQLLDFRKLPHISSVNYTELDVSDIILETVRQFKVLANKKKIDINLDLPIQHIVAYSNRESIIKIVSNLMFNAMKYTSSKIKVKLRISDDNNNFIISVIDNGNGIPEAQKDKIFTLFYRVTTDETIPVPGSGIGLAIVKKLVDLLKGEVTVTDNSPKGSIFSVSIPLGNVSIDSTNTEQAIYEDENDSAETNPSIAQNDLNTPNIQSELKENTDLRQSANNSQLKSILVVEDNEEMRSFLVKKLRVDYNVMSAENGKVALGILDIQYFDLVISDVIMAEMDGIELCKTIKENPKWCHISVILLTACTEDGVRLNGLKEGADAYIEKPFTMSLLRAQIQSIFSNHSRMRQSFIDAPWMPYKGLTNNTADEEFINSLNKIVEQNIANTKFDIEMMAYEINMSRSSLHRRVKEVADMTPNEYLRLYRLKKAAALLSSGDYKITEICYMVGFNTPSYFSKCFQAQFGMTPRDFFSKIEKDSTAD